MASRAAAADAAAVENRWLAYVRLDDLQPDPANPKAHETSVITDSVGRFGYIEPIVEDGRTNRLISGHGRVEVLLAMREDGQSPPEGVTLDEDGHWVVPVVRGWSSRTDAEARAALVALNRTGELGGWVDEALLDILDELADLGDTGLLGTGYGERDIAILAEQLATVVDQDFLDDLAGETPPDNRFDAKVIEKGPEVVLEFVFSKEQRSSVVRALNAYQDEHDLPTKSAVLLHMLGLPYEEALEESE